MDLRRAERLLGDAVEPVLEELSATHPQLPPVMIVGAICRDALHVANGHTESLRRTDDLDIALAVNGPGHFEALTDGVVTPARRAEPMSVFGFQDVYAAAHEIHLPGGSIAYLPTVAGYALLKLRAWADRSPSGEYKDASDLACAMFWYQNTGGAVSHDDDARERLYGSERGHNHLLATDFDEPIALVRLLIDDATALLTPQRRTELRRVWTSDVMNDELLAASLGNPLLRQWPPHGAQRFSQYATAVRAVINDAPGPDRTGHQRRAPLQEDP